MKMHQISELQMPEGQPFLVLRHGNDACKSLIQQVQLFEGEMYPDDMAFAVDWKDRITDAVAWCKLPEVSVPETIEGGE